MSTDLADLSALPVLSERRSAVEILSEQAKTRVPDLVPVRNARMAATPFTFYRGAAAVMAADLAATPSSGIHTQLCGDAHLSNFGMFLTPERRLIFDLNDFDETYPGPFEWDVKRLAASVVVAAQDNGFKSSVANKAARAVARSYRKSILGSIAKSTMDCWYAHVDTDTIVADLGEVFDTSRIERTHAALAKARHRNSLQALEKFCVITDGVAHIRSDPPLLVPVTELFGADRATLVNIEIKRRISDYRATLAPHLAQLLDEFTFQEAARKVVGVGSVGTRAWIVLLVGRDLSDPLFLQIKEAQESVLQPYVDRGPVFDNQGRRVVEGQKLMQAASDVFLGWQAGYDPDQVHHDFYVRQLRDGKGSVVIEALDPEGLLVYAKLCGRTLAQAHARTAERFEIADFVGDSKDFDAAIGEFAVGYAKINLTDHAEMDQAITDGVLTATDIAS